MPLDKNMTHSEMVDELINSYKRTGKIGATVPRDMKHAIEIANAVAYNIEGSVDIETKKHEIKEMRLPELLNTMEAYLDSIEHKLYKLETSNGN